MSLKNSLARDGLDTLDKVLQKTEFENSQQTKAIEIEKEKIKALTQQVDETLQRTKQLEDSMAALDEQAKKLHKEFKSSRDNAESLKHTLSVLEQHANALSEKLQTSVQETHCQRMGHLQQFNKYKAIWLRYEEKYESSTKAKHLTELMGELNVITERGSTLHSEIDQLKQNLVQFQSNSQQQDRIPKVVKIAAIRVETQNIMLQTRQNWCDVALSKQSVLKLVKEVEERKADISKKKLEYQPVNPAQPMAVEGIASSIPAADSGQHSRPSLIKIPTICTMVHTASKIQSSTIEIPQTPRVTLPVEIRQLTLPPVTPVKNKNIFRMDNDTSSRNGHSSSTQARISHQNYLVLHKPIFSVPASTKTTAPTGAFEVPERPNSYTLSVPLKPKPFQRSIDSGCSKAVILPNSTPAKNFSVFGNIESTVKSISEGAKKPNFASLPGNYASGVDANPLSANPSEISAIPNETFEMNINQSGNCMDTNNNSSSENFTSVNIQCSSAGSWFDTWGVESGNVQSDQQHLFSHQPSSGASTGVFSDGFINQGPENDGFPFLAPQENPTADSFFCDTGRMSIQSESNAGFGVAYPFLLHNSEAPKTSLFTF